MLLHLVDHTTCFDQLYFTFNPVAPLPEVSALSEADQTETVVADRPVAPQSDPSEPTGQVSSPPDGTELLPQSGVDFQSEGNLTSLVVPSAEQAHTDVYRCESKSDDVEFAVEVEGDAQDALWCFHCLALPTNCSSSEVDQVTFVFHLTDNGSFYHFPNLGQLLL